MNIQISRLSYFALIASAFVFNSPLMAQPQSSLPLTVTVSSDGRDLEIKRASATDTIRVHVLDKCRNPAVGEPKIRYILMGQGSVSATYGKNCSAKVSLKTFGVECTGCD
jgi:hypothetical protein